MSHNLEVLRFNKQKKKKFFVPIHQNQTDQGSMALNTGTNIARRIAVVTGTNRGMHTIITRLIGVTKRW